MLTVGDKFPAFDLKAVVSTDMKEAFTQITESSYEGKWLVVFFWPKDFTFVCPTEIAAFGKLNGEFADRDAQVLGASTDSEFVHHAWRVHHDDLRDLPFPMLADIKRELSTELGILDKTEGVALRATFIVDPRASSASLRSTTCRSAATRRNSCAFWTPCRPTSCAPATGRRARTRFRRPDPRLVDFPAGHTVPRVRALNGGRPIRRPPAHAGFCRNLLIRTSGIACHVDRSAEGQAARLRQGP